MNNDADKIRVMWLLNHRTARDFELAQLRGVGIDEVFVPKSFPVDEANLSASIDYSFDASLTIPAQDLAVLNATDWYGEPSSEAWAIANRYFKIVFFAFFYEQVENVTRNFQGTCILRAFGLAKGDSYSEFIYSRHGIATVDRIRQMGKRFWFGQAYEHLHEVEHDFLRRRSCYLPLGLADATPADLWEGSDARVLFVCPRIETSPYYEKLYRNFLQLVSGLPYAIGGAQPVKVPDENVLGFVPRDVFDANMRRFRVMFYHDAGPNHIHYHPFEAVRAGMPLVFMAGGILDRLGGQSLPGRCTSEKKARRKIERILAGDVRLTAAIRRTQVRLLDQMRPETCQNAWRDSFMRITAGVRTDVSVVPQVQPAKRRIAVIVPVGYRGGSLRAAKLVAAAIQTGSRLAGKPVDVVFGHLDDPACYTDEHFQDLAPGISRRPYKWTFLDREAANCSMRLSGHEKQLVGDRFAVPSDGINNFLDCDLWLIISDRMESPLLPLRPYALMVYDYIQRYQPFLTHGEDLCFLTVARNACGVLVTTRFTRDDAVQYAGLQDKKTFLVPMICPDIPNRSEVKESHRKYFLWPTNPSIHKNHLNSTKALQIYYDELDGAVDCRMTGPGSRSVFAGDYEHLHAVKELFASSPTLKRRINILGELPDSAYYKQLSGALFLWHTAFVDNGTFCVIEAAAMGVPSLSSDYPAMREIDASFGIHLAWCDPRDPRQMAIQLKGMETSVGQHREMLPSREALLGGDTESIASAYWGAVRSCL